RAMSMDEPSTGRESFIDGSEHGQFIPADWEGCRIKIFDYLGFADNRGDGFTPMPSFLVRKNRLIRKARNHAVTILTRHVFGGKNRLHAGMSRHERLQITEAKRRPMIRASDDTQGERASRYLVCSIDLRAFNFWLTIQADQSLTHRGSRGGTRRLCGLWASIENGRVENRCDYLSISRAAAEYAAQRIRHFAFGSRTIVLQKRGGRDQHARRAGPTLCGSVPKKCILQAVK